MAVTLNGFNLTIENLVRIARDREQIEITSLALDRVKKCRKYFEEQLSSGAVMYGVNTGFGNLSEVVLNKKQIKELQVNLIRSHAAGIGDPAKEEYVRAAMASRINVHLKGRSACRPEITMLLMEMLNKNVIPVVCLKGSVGACGDLAPMAQIALLLFGEGEAIYEGERLPGRVALEKAGVEIPGVEARDGLSFINGSNFLTAISGLLIYDIHNLLKHAEVTCSMAMEALMCNIAPLDVRLHEVRGFRGSTRSALSIHKCLYDGDLYNGKINEAERIQDAYSIRSTPQIIGAVRDAIAFAKEQVEIELNGVGDNPIFFPEYNAILTGANFQGYPVSLPMDMVSAALTAVCVLSERRLNRLLNPVLNFGLPAFLTSNPGLNSGMMISQYTACSLVTEARILSFPASVCSIPAAADQEDFVSMGMNTVLKNIQILENAYGIIGIEMMAAAQALDLRDHKYGKGNQIALETIRMHVDFLKNDRALYIDHNRMVKLLKSGEIVNKIEAQMGELGNALEGTLSYELALSN